MGHMNNQHQSTLIKPNQVVDKKINLTDKLYYWDLIKE